jgi:hypothetical protein
MRAIAVSLHILSPAASALVNPRASLEIGALEALLATYLRCRLLCDHEAQRWYAGLGSVGV